MRIVLDANVFIGGLSVRGTCWPLLMDCLAEHEVVMSEYILEEVRRNIIKKLRTPAPVADGLVDLFRARAIIVEPAPVERGACRHVKDLPVLGTALAGEARCIVTGDQGLLVLKSFRGVKLLSPGEFRRFEDEGARRSGEGREAGGR